MSDTQDKKSMDDVLESIRRVVRADQKSAADKTSDGKADGAPAEDDAPLALTPDMRVTEDGTPLAEGTAFFEPEKLRDLIRAIVREELAGPAGIELVRTAVREELTSGPTGAAASKNVVRLIQAEVARAMGRAD